MKPLLKFRVLAVDGQARRGVIETAHGSLETPGFMAVATRATLKGLDPDAARRAGVQAMICNSFHLHLQPGGPAVEAAGGLHRFMGWDGVLATDSGGFQVFSMRHGQVADELKGRRRLPHADEEPAAAVRVDEEGADFRSYLDGSRHRFTPENNMLLQRRLGADILFALDECTPFHVAPEYTRDAAERNLRWARRCRDAFEELGMGAAQNLFGIVHGGVYPELRRRCAEAVAEMGFEGFGIGDCLGETKADWYRVVEMVCPLLPFERPRHLLGVGEPDDLVEGALRGIDTFDCAMLTRVARHGQALQLGRPRFRFDAGAPASVAGSLADAPLVEGCDCHTCRRFTRGYVNHLVRTQELLGVALLAEHNLRVVTRLLERVRDAISAGRLAELAVEVRAGVAA